MDSSMMTFELQFDPGGTLLYNVLHFLSQTVCNGCWWVREKTRRALERCYHLLPIKDGQSNASTL